MKAKCHKCGEIQTIPDHYAGRDVKCSACRESFRAVKCTPLPETAPSPAPSAANPADALPSTDWLGRVAAVAAALSCIAMLVSVLSLSVIGVAASAICLLLTIIISAIGRLIDAVNANTRAVEKSKES